MSLGFTIWVPNSGHHQNSDHSSPHLLLQTSPPHNAASFLLTEAFLLGGFTPIPVPPVTVRTPMSLPKMLSSNALSLNPHSPKVACFGGPHPKRKVTLGSPKAKAALLVPRLIHPTRQKQSPVTTTSASIRRPVPSRALSKRTQSRHAGPCLPQPPEMVLAPRL